MPDRAPGPHVRKVGAVRRRQDAQGGFDHVLARIKVHFFGMESREPVLAGVVAEAVIRAGAGDVVLHPRLGVSPHHVAGHFFLDCELLPLHLPLGKRLHTATAPVAVRRVVLAPKSMISRKNHAAQNGMRRPHAVIPYGEIAPVGACLFDRLHFGVTPGGVGCLKVGREDRLHKMVGQTEPGDALTEDVEGRSVLQRFSDSRMDKGDLVHFL